MQTRSVCRVSFLIAGMLCLVGMTATASGAIMFSENFSSNSAGPNMALGTGFGSPTTSFASGDFRITSGANSRIYLGTNNTDYSTTNFVFEADVTKPANAGAWGIIYFGMGNSTADGSNFGEPITGSDLLMVLRSDNGNIESRDNATSATGTVMHSAVFPINTLVTFGMRMTWNAGTGTALFEFDQENDGIYNGVNDRSFSLNGGDNGFTAANSQLLLGGGNGLIFDNVSVIPEPSTLALLGFFSLGLLFRRRIAG